MHRMPGEPKPEVKEKTADEKVKDEFNQKLESERRLTVRSQNFERLYGSYKNWPDYEWINGPPDDENLAPHLRADDGSAVLNNGIYRKKGKNPGDPGYLCDILYEDGKTSAIPFKWEDHAQQKEMYKEVWDFLAKYEGATSVEADFPDEAVNSRTGPLSDEKLLKMIAQQFEIAEEKQMGITLGSNVQKFLLKLDPKVRDDIQNRQKKIEERYGTRNRLIYASDNSKQFTTLSGKFKDPLLSTASTDAEKTAFRDKIYSDGKVGAEDGKKTKAVVDALKNLNKSLEADGTLVLANQKLEATIAAYQKLLKNPELFETLPKPAGILENLRNFVGADSYEKLQDPAVLINHIRELNDKNYDAREMLIDKVQKNLADLETQLSIWESELTQLKNRSPAYDAANNKWEEDAVIDVIVDPARKAAAKESKKDIVAAEEQLAQAQKDLNKQKATFDLIKKEHDHMPKTGQTIAAPLDPADNRFEVAQKKLEAAREADKIAKKTAK